MKSELLPEDNECIIYPQQDWASCGSVCERNKSFSCHQLSHHSFLNTPAPFILVIVEICVNATHSTLLMDSHCVSLSSNTFTNTFLSDLTAVQMEETHGTKQTRPQGENQALKLQSDINMKAAHASYNCDKQCSLVWMSAVSLLVHFTVTVVTLPVRLI